VLVRRALLDFFPRPEECSFLTANGFGKQWYYDSASIANNFSSVWY